MQEWALFANMPAPAYSPDQLAAPPSTAGANSAA